MLTILKTGMLGFVLHGCLNIVYPEKYQNFLISTSYNFFYFCSKIQILFMKLSKKMEENPHLLRMKNNFVLLMNQKSNNIIDTVEYIKNGEYVKQYDLCDDSKIDFLLYSWSDHDNECVNKKIIYDKNEIVVSSELCDIKFILIEINFGNNKSHKINLKTDRFNFYIVGNVFTKQFFIFYLKQFLKLNEEINGDDKINIKIIDHNISIIELDFTEKNENIILEKDGYRISECK